MNRVYKILLVASVALFAIACGDEAPVGDEWGRTEYYESSIFKKYKPVIMEQELMFRLDEDGQKMFANGEGIVELYVTSKPGENIPNRDVVVHLNGDKLSDNKISICITDVEKPIYCTLGLEFLGSAADGEHHLYLYYDKETGAHGYEEKVRVETGAPYEKVEHDALDVDLGALADKDGGFYIIKNTVKNPGSVMFCCIVCGILLLFILSIIISRLRTSTIQVKYLIVTGAYQKRLTIKGYREVVLTSRKQKQSFMSKLYTGNILYEVHSSWVSDVKILPGSRKTIRIRYNGSDYVCDGCVLEATKSYTLEDLTSHQKTILKVE